MEIASVSAGEASEHRHFNDTLLAEVQRCSGGALVVLWWCSGGAQAVLWRFNSGAFQRNDKFFFEMYCT